jgi:hypothetical protein
MRKKIDTRGTHAISLGAKHQLAGRLRPLWGHAGHSTANEPSAVAVMPAGLCPQPPRLSI